MYKTDIFYFNFHIHKQTKWVAVQALVQERIVLLRLTWNVRGATTIPSDAAITVDLGFVPCTSVLMFKRVLVRSNILKGCSNAYRNAATVIMMRMDVVAVAVTKCVTAVLYVATNITQYIDSSTFYRSIFICFSVYSGYRFFSCLSIFLFHVFI
jgi:hypothetical protein